MGAVGGSSERPSLVHPEPDAFKAMEDRLMAAIKVADGNGNVKKKMARLESRARASAACLASVALPTHQARWKHVHSCNTIMHHMHARATHSRRRPPPPRHADYCGVRQILARLARASTRYMYVRVARSTYAVATLLRTYGTCTGNKYR